MNAFEVQQYIPDRNQEEIRLWLIENNFPCTPFEQKLIYLGYLIMQGRYEDTAYFISDLYDNNQEEVPQLLNTSHALFDFGTVLHAAVFWNSGQVGMEFAQLLYSHGARFYKNTRNQFPWEQMGGQWRTPLDHINFGERESSEFEPLYQDLYDMHYPTVDDLNTAPDLSKVQ